MFHVKQFEKYSIHELLFYIFLFIIPIQTRILYNPEAAYINWYLNYHQAFFFYLTDIVLLACFSAWLIFDRPSGKLFETKLFWLIIAFLCLILATLFHVKQPVLGLYQALKWAELLLLCIYIWQTLKTTIQFQIAGIVIFVSAALQAILGFFQFHVQHGLGLSWVGEYIGPFGTPGLATIDTVAGKLIRAYGTFPHPNILGAFLIFGLLIGFWLVSHGTRRFREAVSLGILLISLGLFATFSRLAWLAAALATISFIAYYFKTHRKQAAIAILIPVLVSCATIGLFFRADLKARVSDSSQTSVSDRYFFDKLGLNIVKRFPTLGVGVGNYVAALTDLNKLEAWQTQPAHNIFIFIAAELGLVGLILFIIILYEIFSGLRNVPWEPLVFSLALLGILFLLIGQFDHYFLTIQQGRLIFFTMLGLIAALPNLYKEDAM